MPEFHVEQRRELLAKGRALPPDPGRFPIRPRSREDVADAVRDVNRIPESERPAVRAHITRWAIHDGTESELPDTWRVHG